LAVASFVCSFSLRSSRFIDEMSSYLYALGGYGDAMHYLNLCERFSIKESTWEYVPSMPAGRSLLAAAVIGNSKIFVIGGRDHTGPLATTLSLDISTGKWSDVAPLPARCSGLGGTTVNDAVYVAGGYDGQQWLASLTRYDARLGRWETCPAMPTERTTPGVVSVGESVFVLGGSSSKGTTAVVERFDTRANRWEKVSEMPEKQFAFAIAPVNDGRVHIAGGRDNSPNSPFVKHWAWSVRDNRWEAQPALLRRRGSPGGAAVQGQFYVLGGSSSDDAAADSVSRDGERFNATNGRWEPLPTMISRREKLALVCVTA